MPKGPKGEKRPADAIGCAVMVAKIATGEMEDELPAMSGRTRSGKAGGVARREALDETERSAIAKVAAKARWRKEADMTAFEQVKELYRNKEADGLFDVKFYVGNRSEATKEAVAQDILNLEEALERKDFVPLVFNDRH